MKKTQALVLFPMSKGLNKTAVPGTQDPKSLITAKNVVLRNRPSLRKRPGLRRIEYAGADDGTQAVTQFIATTGSGQRSEVVRARKGRLEALRDVGGSTPHFVDLGVTFSDSDTVTFERFNNVLMIFFENSRPLYYPIGGTPSNINILNSHIPVPPAFGRFHDFRLWYSGRPADPHKAWVSAINSYSDFTLLGGGFSIRIRDGDGDLKGMTGISESFRGDLYFYKWSSVYRIFRSSIGYGIDLVTDEVGAVHHNAIKATQNDVFSVASDGIHSLVLTDKYGANEISTITYPIYEYFQENVNWNNAKNMVLAYEAKAATLLLSYTAAGSSFNNRILGYNLNSKEFFEWEDCEYPSLFRYFDVGRKSLAVADNVTGISILDDKENTLNGSPIDFEVETDTIFPAGSPKAVVTMTQAWLLAKPPTKSVLVKVSYSLDSNQLTERTVDTLTTGYGANIAGTDQGLGGGIIGTDIIGKMKENMIVLPFECTGECSAIAFNVKQEPPDGDADQSCEVLGIIYEFEYDEDTLQIVRV